VLSRSRTKLEKELGRNKKKNNSNESVGFVAFLPINIEESVQIQSIEHAECELPQLKSQFNLIKFNLLKE
jgi:hypothetical protein